MAKPAQPGFTPDADPILPVKNKRYTPVMTAIHAIDRIMGKLTPAESAQVYLHYRNIFQAELSFAPQKQ